MGKRRKRKSSFEMARIITAASFTYHEASRILVIRSPEEPEPPEPEPSTQGNLLENIEPEARTGISEARLLIHVLRGYDPEK